MMTVLWKSRCTAISNIWQMLTVVIWRTGGMVTLMQDGNCFSARVHHEKKEVAHHGEETENA